LDPNRLCSDPDPNLDPGSYSIFDTEVLFSTIFRVITVYMYMFLEIKFNFFNMKKQVLLNKI